MFAQGVAPNKIPQTIKVKVDSLFPKVSKVEWSKKGLKYEADFLYENRSISITFNKKGNIVKAAKEIDYAQLPSPIREKIAKRYSDYKLYFFLENVHKGKIDYEVEIMKGRNFYILNYKENGELLNKYDIIKSDTTNLTPTL